MTNYNILYVYNIYIYIYGVYIYIYAYIKSVDSLSLSLPFFRLLIFLKPKSCEFLKRQGTQDIQAVLHQRSISIQHEHMCEVLGAYQVLVEHPGNGTLDL